MNGAGLFRAQNVHRWQRQLRCGVLAVQRKAAAEALVSNAGQRTGKSFMHGPEL